MSEKVFEGGNETKLVCQLLTSRFDCQKLAKFYGV